MQRRVALLSTLVFVSALLAPTVHAAPLSADCEFKLGFAALANMLPDTVGQCLADEAFSPVNGDSRQPTTGGLLVWRKADNWTVFTDGTSTFLNGPNGLQQRLNSQRFSWEIDAGSYLAAETNFQFADLTPEDAIAASLHAADVQQLFPGEQWFESFPVFHQPPFAGNPSVQWLNRRFLVSTNFQRVSGTPAVLDASIAVFENETAASAGMAELTATGDQDGVEMAGASIASESHYYARADADDSNQHVALVRWRRGPTIARVRMAQTGTAVTPEALATYAGLVDTRIQALLAGTLTRMPLPEELASLLPISGQGIGPIMGSAVVSPESWALIDTADDPPEVLGRLRLLGADRLVARSYALSASDTTLVEVTFFPFADDEAATSWVSNYLESSQSDGSAPLDAGQTGEQSAFSQTEFGYELQFARGRYVADVFCYAPFAGDTSPACEQAVRQLAEQWYAMLPAG